MAIVALAEMAITSCALLATSSVCNQLTVEVTVLTVAMSVAVVVAKFAIASESSVSRAALVG